MRAWHSLHITIKAQTQKHTVHWTHLLRAFPCHGSGALIVVLSRNGTGSQRVTFWDDGTNGVRECNMMWALTFKVPLPMFSGRDDDWPVWSARFGAYVELAGWTGVLEVAEAQTAPISMVGASPEAIRLGKIICAVLLTKTEGKAFFQHCSSHTKGSRS